MILNVQPVMRFHLVRPLPGTRGVWAVLTGIALPALFAATTLYATVVGKGLRSVTHLTGLVSRSTLPPLVAIVFLIWATSVWATRRDWVVTRNVILVGGAYVLTLLLIARFLTTYQPTNWISNFERTLLVLPLAAASGWVLVTSGRIERYFSWLVALAVVTVVPAIYEYARHTSLFHTAGTIRNGSLRAVVGSDNPLVLGTLFAALIPIAVWLCGRWGIAVGVWLWFGTFLTGSAGPEVVGGLVLAVAALRPLSRLLLTRWEPLTGILVAVIAFLAYGSAYLWTTELRAASGSAVSHAYRGALYHVLPKLLAVEPWGYGPGGLPNRVWFVQTSDGPFDLGRSLDSEVVYAAAQFGYLAIVVLVVVALIAICAVPRHNAIGLTTVSLTMVGFFLAVHAWFSLATFWFLCVGACAALLWSPLAQPWVGLARAEKLTRRADRTHEGAGPYPRRAVARAGSPRRTA